MAGIGFELKKLFSRRGLLATLRAYGYAGLVCTGPMILGVVLLLGITLIAQGFGLARESRELLVSMFTYALLSSLVVTSIFTVLTTRCTADMLYVKNDTGVINTFYGSLSIMLTVSAILYGIFLCFSFTGKFSFAYLDYIVVSLILQLSLIVVWTEITYLTAIKDYKNIIIAFAISLAIAFLVGILLIWLVKLDIILSLLIGVCCGYGVMMVWYFVLLHRYFPDGFGTKFEFFKWFDSFPQLSLVGFFNTVGLFGHLLIMWASPIGVQVQGLYYGAPAYDVAALVAFFSILITTINFVTSVEVRFYPQYKTYFSLFNDGGAIEDIDNAEQSMKRVLRDELSYLAQKQLFATLIFIIIGTLLLPNMGLGFTNEMLGIFRVLCVGYAFYAIGNSVMLLQLYFSDNKSALISVICFAFFTNLFTIMFINNGVFYGFGFVFGGLIFCVVALVLLSRFMWKLKYNVLCKQPMFSKEKTGLLTKLADSLDVRARKKQKKRLEYYEKNKEEVHDEK